MQTHTYPTNLTDAEWARLEPLLPAARTGRPRHHSLRTIVDALLYVLRTGCAWRLLPADWPAWQSVYYYLRKWRREGTLERIHTVLREELRIALGRDPQPSAGSVDRQSVKTTSTGGEREMRLRWRQEAGRAQTAYSGRYRRVAARGQRPSRQYHGPRWH